MNYGKVRLDAQSRKWIIETEPHVAMRLRRMFESCRQASGASIRLDDSPSNARELEWFLERYPHEMEASHRRILTYGAAGHREREENTRAIIEGRISLGTIELALPLREYQKVAYDLVQTVNGILCADDLGLGKTAVGVASAIANSPALVVCQTHLQEQWRDEIRKFAPRARVRIAPTGRPENLGPWDVLIIPYTKLAGWRDFLAGTIVTIVLDEIQELRDQKTAKYAAASHIMEQTRFRLGLSATPIYNYGGEIFNTLDLLRPGELGSHEEFTREWCHCAGNGKWIVNDPLALRAFLLSNAMMIRRTRKDVGRELPPLVKVQHKCQFNPALLDSMKDDALQLAKKILSSETSFVDKGMAAREFDSKLRQTTGIAKAPYVAGMASDMAGDGQKIIVAAWHREVYAILCARFKADGIPFYLYTGSETPAQKVASAQAFINHRGGAVFIMSLRSGAGLNGLQMVSDTILYAELDWSPKAHDQLNGRLVRDGQENSVNAIYCTIDGGSDPIVAGVLGLKDEQSTGIVDGTEIADEDTTLEANELGSRIKVMAEEYVKRNSHR